MDNRVFKVLTIILSALLFLALIFVIFFGVRLAKINSIKAKEMNDNVSKREKEIQQACQLDKERTLTTYTADEIFGSFQFSFPKAWFTNVMQQEGEPELQYLANPELIVMNNDRGPVTALRVTIFRDKLASKAKGYESLTNGGAKAFEVQEVTLSGLKGKRFTGSTNDTKDRKISFVLLPLRDKTLYIGTDNFSLYQSQFESIIKSFNISK